MTYPYWHYFLALENDFEATTRFVEPSPSNHGTHSIEFAKILFGICSEIDVIAKLLCEKARPGTVVRNIDDYRKCIVAAYPKLPSTVVRIPRYNLPLEPWKEWSNSANPQWWRDYNDVKHERNQYFDRANLGNCMHALAGLFVLVLYLYQAELYDLKLEPRARLLALLREPDNLVHGGYELPDFPQG